LTNWPPAGRSLAEVARNEGIAKRYVERLSRLAFVAPAIVEAICLGQQPAELSAETLLNRIDPPLECANRLKDLFEGELSQIREYLNWMKTDAEQFNRELETLARERITLRADRIRRERGVAASIGFPMRRRQGAPETYVAPAMRRKAPVTMPPATHSGKPESILEMAEYENILRIVASMVDVMERSPHTFRNIGEEELRTHFLVQLNGQYEGQASCETFNFEGKTDILIRVEGRNIFVSECTMWYGAEKLNHKIDQLLGYATWRDSKLALLVFNRTKNFTAVLKKVSEVVRAHRISEKRSRATTPSADFE
jgi:hypothetical protein